MSRLKAAVLYYFKPHVRRNSNNLKTPDSRKAKSDKNTKQSDDKINLTQFADDLSSTVIENALPRTELQCSPEPLDSPEGLVQLADQILEKVMDDVSMVYVTECK